MTLQDRATYICQETVDTAIPSCKETIDKDIPYDRLPSCQETTDTDIPRHRLLHLPEYTHGSHFAFFIYGPRTYHSFLQTTTQRLCQTLPSVFINEVRSKEAHMTSHIPSAYQSLPSCDNTFIGIDCGTTFGCTQFKEDIIAGTIEDVNLSIKELSTSSKIVARGFGRWNVIDQDGKTATIEPYLHMVPDSDVRLFSPQHFFQGLKGGNYHMDKDTTILK